MSQIREQVIISLKTFNTSTPAYRIVTPATGAANTVKVWDTNTCLIMGVTTSEHSVTGAAVSIAIGGTAKISCGENISVGSGYPTDGYRESPCRPQKLRNSYRHSRGYSANSGDCSGKRKHRRVDGSFDYAAECHC